MQETRFDPWCRKMAWRRAWQLNPVFLPEESHGQRSLVGYRPWDPKESVTTKQLRQHALNYVWIHGLGGVWAMHNVKSETKEAPPEFPSTGLRPNNNIAQSLLFHPGRLLKEEDWGNECNGRVRACKSCIHRGSGLAWSRIKAKNQMKI